MSRRKHYPPPPTLEEMEAQDQRERMERQERWESLRWANLQVVTSDGHAHFISLDELKQLLKEMSEE